MADVQQIRFPTEDPNHVYKVGRTMLIFTAMMVTLPIFLYFFSKSFVFEGVMGMTRPNSYFYAAIVAIIAVHIVLGLFIYAAFTEGASKPVKKD